MCTFLYNIHSDMILNKYTIVHFNMFPTNAHKLNDQNVW